MPDTTASWIWWIFSAIILSLLINLISDYLKPAIDKIWGNYSSAQNKKNEKRKREILEAVNRMHSNQKEAFHTYYLSLYYLIVQYAYLVIFFIFLGFAFQSNTNKTENIFDLPNLLQLLFLFVASITYIFHRLIIKKSRKYQEIIGKYRKDINTEILRNS